MMEYSNSVLLLTACINPNGMAYTVLQDKDERLLQYREALDWYLAHVKNKIVFVENTGHDISPLYESYIKSEHLEVLTFQGNDFDKSKGKGYGEALIIDYALNNSRFIRSNSTIIKITGRRICLNIKNIISKCSTPPTVYASIVNDELGNVDCDSQVFVAPYDFIKNVFLKNSSSINDSTHIYFEHVLYDSINNWIKGGGKFKEIWFPILLDGTSGSSGDLIKPTLTYKIKFYIRYILHRFGYYGPIMFYRPKLKRI